MKKNNIFKVGDYVKAYPWLMSPIQGKIFHTSKGEYLNLVEGGTIKRELYQIMVLDNSSPTGFKMEDIRDSTALTLLDFPERQYDLGTTVWYCRNIPELESGTVVGFSRRIDPSTEKETIFVILKTKQSVSVEIAQDKIVGHEPKKG